MDSPPPLTDQESQILTLIASGKSARAICIEAGLEAAHFNRQLAACRSKLAARNNTELVAKAFLAGQL